MELRPVQTVLLAGRAASRWATSTSTTGSRPSIPLSIYASTFSRPFSSTRIAFQEAEATAPSSSETMTDYFKQRTQQQAGRQQQQQQQTQTRSQKQPQPSTNSVYPPPSTPSNLSMPWASRRHSNAQVVPARPSLISSKGLVDDLGINDPLRPDMSDLEQQRKGAFFERPIDVKYRLRPVVGRTVELTTGAQAAEGLNASRNVDFAKALGRLDMQVKVNRIKADANRQRFHERNGLKKKRLRSERWQRRFMDGFRATCRRVSELAKQGW